MRLAAGGTQLALRAFVLGGFASQSQILAFSIGRQAVITLANPVLGVVALLRAFGHVGIGRPRYEAAAPSA